MLWLYISRNFAKLVGLECPEPLANLYSRSYFRATWITTAMDAGFWTAMNIKRKAIRDLASMVFTVYYLFAAEQADEKARKVRGSLTVEHLRVSWNKGTTPYLAFFSRMLRPKLASYPPRKIRIPRPEESSYTEPITAWLYYDAPFSTISRHAKVVLDVPGGGFVAMDPRTNDDKLFAWAGKTGLPILSLDYRKAPEDPYPYALNEVYDVYRTLMATAGRCIGLSGETRPHVIMTGDSAGGNLCTSAVLMLIQAAEAQGRQRSGLAIQLPAAVILMYPGLDMNIGNWMTDEQMALIQDRHTRATNKNILRRKSEDYYKLDPATPHQSDEDDDDDDARRRGAEAQAQASSPRVTAAPPSANGHVTNAQAHLPLPLLAHTTNATSEHASVSSQTTKVVSSKPAVLKTRLAMSSMISYFNDRILTPEMMRAMIILYVGPFNRPDFSTDYLLSPLLAPEALLARFPKTYFLTGERDPLVDDTVIFAGRLRQAKYNDFLQRQELGLLERSSTFEEKDHVQVALIPGISHGFLQFVSIFPEGWRLIFRCARWMNEVFAAVDAADASLKPPANETVEHSDGASESRSSGPERPRHHARRATDSSADEDRPLEMTAIRGAHGQAPSSRRAGASKGRGRKRRTSPPTSSRQKSLVSLASSDDLLGKRMHGLAGGLLGMTEGGSVTP